MKIFFIVSLLIAATLANEYIEKLETAAKECGIGGVGELRALEAKGEKTTIGPTLFCMNKKIGIQDSNGIVHAEGVANHIRKTHAEKDESEQNKIIENCDKPTGDSGADKAYNLFLCVIKNLH
uniref:Odorant-binding protein 6 n=1 Tax=Pyrrhalta aenescens TaxID=281545 RepID=A0A1J0KKM8_9CUCU|nr:odorant-binding protein 6 [Pyrrhalta aenescens]